MKFCTITPTRGDRPELLANCKRQLARMLVKPDLEIYIDRPPHGPGFDLIDRVKEGVEIAKGAGFDYVFIIEDDDYYPETYFNGLDPGADFVGEYSTLYYNIRNKTYTRWQHARHSSLFTSGFRISALEDFPWPTDTVFLDVHLWKHITRITKGYAKMKLVRESGALGMKHGIGVCGGKGHKQRGNNEDSVQMHWLRENMDKQSFEFYYHLANKL